MIEKVVSKLKTYGKKIREFFKFRSSIYGQVVIIIGLLAIFLFVAFGTIFRTVNKEYMESIIQQSGNNVCLLVEGALYQHMLENDKTALKNMLTIINEMPGIEDVNMYDSLNNLVYSSFGSDSSVHSNPNCKLCHPSIHNMFPTNEMSFKIVNIDSECEMTPKKYASRMLLIRSPILNEKSCYTASCHAHEQNETVLGSFIIRIPLEELDANLNKSFLLSLLTTVLLVLFLMLYTRLRVKKPLNAIMRASEIVSKGSMDTRLAVDKNEPSDVQMVASAFNEMLDNLQSKSIELQQWSQQLENKVQEKTRELAEIQNELIHIERMASLGKLSSSVAHEINNPLAGVLTYTKLVNKKITKFALDETQKQQVQKYLHIIETETKRCGDIVNGLLEFSRKDRQDFEEKHLHKILDDVYTLMSHQMKIANINFTTNFAAKSDLIKCNENQIKQACVALLLNASEAVFENGEISIETSNTEDQKIKIDIVDDGLGIAAEDIPLIFEPFFSTKEKGRGIGLGLAIVHGIVQNHNGSVQVKSDLGKGTCISILLPVSNTE